MNRDPYNPGSGQLEYRRKSGGYDRIVGALANLGYRLSDQTVGNILGLHGISPAPKRKQPVSWKNFIRAHRDVLVGMVYPPAVDHRLSRRARLGDLAAALLPLSFQKRYDRLLEGGLVRGRVMVALAYTEACR